MKPSKFPFIKVFLFAILIFTGCENKKDSKSTATQATSSTTTKSILKKRAKATVVKKQVIPLRKKLDDLLVFDGLECKKNAEEIKILKSSYSNTNSTFTTNTSKHTNISSNGSGSYTTTEYSSGGDTYTQPKGATINVEISNSTGMSMDVTLNIETYYDYWNTFYDKFDGDIMHFTRVEHLKIPVGGMVFSKYYYFSGAITGTIDTSLDIREDERCYWTYNEHTLSQYTQYLKSGGCHYRVKEIKNKIKTLFIDKTYKEILAIKDHKKRIKKLEEFLEVFKNTENGKLAKTRLLLDKRMLLLLPMTSGYKTIVWEEDNPLLYSFKSVLKKEDYSSNLLFFVDECIKASKKKYKKETYVKEKSIAKEPLVESFGVIPTKEAYPTKPKIQKGEFEKQKDFTKRESKAFATYQSEKDAIDLKYTSDMSKYKIKQKKLYELAYTKWLKEKKETQEENVQEELRYKKKMSVIDTNTQQWIWQAVVQAMGTKKFKFTKLAYDSERELFEYVLRGGILNFEFTGSISVPIAEAKKFKASLLENTSIVFKIKDKKLYIENFMYKGKPILYTITSKTKLVLVDKKLLIIKEKKRVRKEKIAKSTYFDKKTKLMWQDDRDAQSVTKEWNDAKSYCKSLTIGEYYDWRLPDYNELLSIVDYKKYNPAIKSGLKNVASYYYWSSSQNVSDSSRVWEVNFDDGSAVYNSQSYKHYVRCVRGRQ